MTYPLYQKPTWKAKSKAVEKSQKIVLVPNIENVAQSKSPFSCFKKRRTLIQFG